MKKILVAGGAGYVGSVLVPALALAGHDVTVIDLLWFGNFLPQAIKLIQGDLFNLTETDLKEFDTVIFLAGLSNDPMADFSPRLNFVSNVSAPAYLAFTAKRAGVKRFIHGGSCSVYGSLDDADASETSPTSSNYAYGISKLNGETAVSQMGDADFSVINFRKGTVSGNSPRMRFDLLINAMVKDVIRHGVVTVNGTDTWRPVLGINDAVDAYMNAVDAPEHLSGVFNIASFNSSVMDIGCRIASMFNAKLAAREGRDARSYRAAITAAQDILGFRPRETVESIASDVHSKWRESNKDLLDDSFYNIRTFEKKFTPVVLENVTESERSDTAAQSTPKTIGTDPGQEPSVPKPRLIA